MALTPNATATVLGVKINEKIIPDGYRWKDDTKAKKAGFDAKALFKANEKLNDGKVSFVTIHNTNDLDNVHDDAEQYTRATYPNENMGSSRVHYYVDELGAWQNLKAGTGLFAADPKGSAEVGWHSGDYALANGGNRTSLSIEIIMNDNAEHDAKAKDNGARIAAWLLYVHGLSIDKLVTHTYWVNKAAGKTFSDPDAQSTNLISGRKWCPSYIFASNNPQVAKKNWLAFKALVKTYLDELSAPKETPKKEETTKKEEKDMELVEFKKLFNQMRQELRDNDAGAWSKEARDWAVSTGLVQGTGDGKFNGAWEDLLTREQLVTVLYRFAQIMGKA
jgi:N-acetylmuramoyl-L-alanine amidase CwlA